MEDLKSEELDERKLEELEDLKSEELDERKLEELDDLKLGELDDRKLDERKLEETESLDRVENLRLEEDDFLEDLKLDGVGKGGEETGE